MTPRPPVAQMEEHRASNAEAAGSIPAGRAIRPGRIPCINLRCRRTAPADRYESDTEIICGKCFRFLPPSLRRIYRTLTRRETRVLRRIERRVAGGTITADGVNRIETAFRRRRETLWCSIRNAVNPADRPAGLDSILEELGLAGVPR